MPQFKKCSRCGEIKPTEDWPRNRYNNDGLQGACRICYLQYCRLWRKTERGIALEYRRRSSDRRRKCTQEYNKTWRAKYPDYPMERYYKIQNEASCHSSANAFYPAYRFIKALVDAEVVEI